MFRWIASLGSAMRHAGRSLRWRILAWYSVILALSLLVISLLLLWQTARGVWVDVDSDLLAGAKLIDGGMRRLPPDVLASISPDAGLRRDTIHRPPPGGPPWDNRPRRPVGPDDVRRPMRPPRAGSIHGGERPPGPPPRNTPDGIPFPPPDAPGGEMPVPRSNAWLLPDTAPAPLELDALISDDQSPDEPAPNWPPQRDAFERSLDWVRLERIAPLRLGIEDARAYSLVWSADGTLLHRSRPPREDIDLGEGEIKSIAFANPTDRMMRQMRGPFREVLLRGPDESVICVGMDASREIERIGKYALFLLLSCGTVFGVALVGGNWCLKRTLQPLREMEATSAAIHAEHLDRRFDVASMDREVADVASSINTMLDRLQQGFEQQKQFTADASHELRTPLAIMLSSTELALSRDRSAEVYKRELEKCQRAASRMHGLVDRLLTLSRLDAQSLEPPNDPIALDAVAVEQIELLRGWASERSIELSAEVEPCSLAADADAMGRLIANLLINAIHYNRAGGWVRLQLQQCPADAAHSESFAKLSVSDNGIGIPSEEIPKLFKRFFRVDKARSRAPITDGVSSHANGSGLGLAICDSIVRWHRGSIRAESLEGKGTTMIVELPMTRGSDVR